MGQDRGSVITRIASGCGAAARARVSADVRAFGSPRFRVHFTPEYAGTPAEPPPGDAAAAKVARDDAAGGGYKFYNKPFGLRHWLASPDPDAGTPFARARALIAIVDPDFLFLRPLTAAAGSPGAPGAVLFHDRVGASDLPAGGVVARGVPVGASYRLGWEWPVPRHTDYYPPLASIAFAQNPERGEH